MVFERTAAASESRFISEGRFNENTTNRENVTDLLPACDIMNTNANKTINWKRRLRICRLQR